MGILKLFGKAKEHSQALVIGDVTLLKDVGPLGSIGQPSHHLAEDHGGSCSAPLSTVSSPKSGRRPSIASWIRPKVLDANTAEDSDKLNAMKLQLAKSLKDEFSFENVSFHTDAAEQTKEKCMARIKALFKSSSASNILIHYVGEADECGNWILSPNAAADTGLSNLIVFRELSMLWQKQRQHSQHLVLLLDCPNSGHWVQALASLSRAEQLALSISIQASDSVKTEVEGGMQYPPGVFSPCFLLNNSRVKSGSRAKWLGGMRPSCYSTWMCTNLLDFDLPFYFFSADAAGNKAATPKEPARSTRNKSFILAAPSDTSYATSEDSSGPSCTGWVQGRDHSDNCLSNVDMTPPSNKRDLRSRLSCKHLSSPVWEEIATATSAGSCTTAGGNGDDAFSSSLIEQLQKEKYKQQRRRRGMGGEEELEAILSEGNMDHMGRASVMSTFEQVVNAEHSAETLLDPRPSLMTGSDKERLSILKSQEMMRASESNTGSRLSRMTSAFSLDPRQTPGPEAERSSARVDRGSTLREELLEDRPSCASSDNPDPGIVTSTPFLYEEEAGGPAPVCSSAQGAVQDLRMSRVPILCEGRDSNNSVSGSNALLRYLLRAPKPGAADSEPPSPSGSILMPSRGGRGRFEIGGSETSSFLFNDDEERYKMLKELDEMGDQAQAQAYASHEVIDDDGFIIEQVKAPDNGNGHVMQAVGGSDCEQEAVG